MSQVKMTMNLRAQCIFCDLRGRVSVERLSVALTGRAKSVLGGQNNL